MCCGGRSDILVSGRGGFTEAASEPVQRMRRLRACPEPELLRPAAPGGTGTHRREDRLLCRGQKAKGLWACHHQDPEGGEEKMLL